MNLHIGSKVYTWLIQTLSFIEQASARGRNNTEKETRMPGFFVVELQIFCRG